ncbi:MAG TPA: AgmX/PglI C-terminal domain-containing protein [Polyangiaceae bacterium]
MTTSTPPPPKSSNRPFIVAMLVMVVVVAALVVYKCSSSDEKPTQQPPETVTNAPTVAIPDQIVPPPPPPPTASAEDAGATPGTKKPAVQSTFCQTCGSCTGTAAPNFQSVVRGRAGAAQRCYEKALSQQDSLQGKLTVNLCVGVGGGVCGASVASDSLGSPLVSQCVLNLFRSTVFPSPKNGCVDAQVPLNFVPQKQ